MVNPRFACRQSSRVAHYPDSRRYCCRAGYGRVHRLPAASAFPRAVASPAGHESLPAPPLIKSSGPPGILLYHDCRCTAVGAVAIFLTVRLIVFLIETDAVPERKTVMRREQIDRGMPGARPLRV